MRALTKTEAVVLRAIKYRESSKIVTLYTRAFGKVQVVAKGARRPKSTFAASLEPMSRVMTVFYKSENRDLHLLSQCDVVRSFPRVADNFDKMAVGFSIVELIDKVSHGEAPNEKLFGLVTESLSLLNSTMGNPRNVLYGFEIGLAASLGFQPSFDRCVVCGNAPKGEEATFHVGKGGPLCRRHDETPGMKMRISSDSLRICSSLENLARAGTMEIDETPRKEIGGLLLGYLRYHIDGLQNLKTRAMLQLASA